MNQAGKWYKTIGIVAAIGAVLTACGTSNGTSGGTPQQTAQTGKAATGAGIENKEAAAPKTRMFEDWKKRQVEIPADPKRIVFSGETYGDLLALGVNAVGTYLQPLKGTILESRVNQVADIGFPINLEKTLELKPDLIIIATSDEKTVDALNKIAPTVTFDTFATIEQRMTTLGQMLGKQQEAAKWLDAYKLKSDAMWKKLRDAGMKQDETASVFTYYPGNKLYVMAGAGLPQFLYQQNGFKPMDKTRELISQNKGFSLISQEVLQEYAGDRIFILTPATEEARKSTDDLMKTRIWNELPAVKNGHVYVIPIERSSSDATTREWMIDELPKLLAK
ncbi:ABC transporter substrate-binding protein [Paenibacillus hodogayensis]|uniref:ABC transporter substrate-binding protein n=1 Tax=Paenibacillus hodogayensis TaxID=279208 RepID=A0ABV5VZ20_9BACL